MATVAERLQASVAAVCPIFGVSIGTPGDSASCRFQPLAIATPAQLSAAQTAINAFDWSVAAQTAYENLQARTAADVALGDPGPACKLQRAAALALLDEINALRGWITSLKSAVAAATTLADMKTRVAALASMPDRTAAQVRTAITGKIDSGAADI